MICDKLVKKNVYFPDLVDHWFRNHSLEITAGSALNYRSKVRYLKEKFPINAKKITVFMLQDMVMELIEKNYTPNTLWVYRKILRMIFAFGCTYYYLPSNPVESVIFPKPTSAEHEPFSADEIGKILSTVMKDWIRDAIIIALKTGMRKGEIFALKWADINFEKRGIYVERTQAPGPNGSIIFKKPKTKYSERTIFVDAKLIAHLYNLKELSKSEYIFSKSDGSNRDPHNISAEFRKVCQKAGVKPRSFHTLRHTHTTILLEAGISDVAITERLGWGSTDMLKTYGHVTPKMRAEIEKLFMEFPGQ